MSLPADRSERWVWRIGLTIVILMVLYILFWLVRTVWHSFHRIHDAYYNIDTGRAPIVELS